MIKVWNRNSPTKSATIKLFMIYFTNHFRQTFLAAKAMEHFSTYKEATSLWYLGRYRPTREAVPTFHAWYVKVDWLFDVTLCGFVQVDWPGIPTLFLSSFYYCLLCLKQVYVVEHTVTRLVILSRDLSKFGQNSKSFAIHGQIFMLVVIFSLLKKGL